MRFGLRWKGIGCIPSSKKESRSRRNASTVRSEWLILNRASPLVTPWPRWPRGITGSSVNRSPVRSELGRRRVLPIRGGFRRRRLRPSRRLPLLSGSERDHPIGESIVPRFRRRGKGGFEGKGWDPAGCGGGGAAGPQVKEGERARAGPAATYAGGLPLSYVPQGWAWDRRDSTLRFRSGLRDRLAGEGHEYAG